MTENGLVDNGHLSAEIVAAYVDRALPVAESDQVESHLAECVACRSEYADVVRLTRPGRLRIWHLAVPAVAAAALLLAVLPRSMSEPEGAPRLRGASDDARFAVVAPSVDSEVRGDSVPFVWRSAGTDVRYRLVVATADGGEVFSTGTGDTAFTLLRADPGLAPATYFWFVDALYPDGRSATTGIRRFTVRP